MKGIGPEKLSFDGLCGMQSGELGGQEEDQDDTGKAGPSAGECVCLCVRMTTYPCVCVSVVELQREDTEFFPVSRNLQWCPLGGCDLVIKKKATYCVS